MTVIVPCHILQVRLDETRCSGDPLKLQERDSQLSRSRKPIHHDGADERCQAADHPHDRHAAVRSQANAWLLTLSHGMVGLPSRSPVPCPVFNSASAVQSRS